MDAFVDRVKFCHPLPTLAEPVGIATCLATLLGAEGFQDRGQNPQSVRHRFVGSLAFHLAEQPNDFECEVNESSVCYSELSEPIELEGDVTKEGSPGQSVWWMHITLPD